MNHEKRKLPRFHITPCQFLDQKLGKTFSVQDISRGGLAVRLLDRIDLTFFTVGSVHEGWIKLEGYKLSASFQVRYIRGSLIGGSWVEPSAELLGHLEQISHPEKLGASLKRYEHPDSNSTTWYHSPLGVDLLFYEQGGLSRWMLFLHQGFVQWEKDSGVTTGRSMAEDEEGYAHGIVRLETRLIEYDPQVDRNFIEFAKNLLEHAMIERSELKNLMYSHLNGVI
ncbi:hypothetical protein EB061_04300 [bacterium]|nr:hypothetical protein [bacterium]